MIFGKFKKVLKPKVSELQLLHMFRPSVYFAKRLIPTSFRRWHGYAMGDWAIQRYASAVGREWECAVRDATEEGPARVHLQGRLGLPAKGVVQRPRLHHAIAWRISCAAQRKPEEIPYLSSSTSSGVHGYFSIGVVCCGAFVVEEFLSFTLALLNVICTILHNSGISVQKSLETCSECKYRGIKVLGDKITIFGSSNYYGIAIVVSVLQVY